MNRIHIIVCAAAITLCCQQTYAADLFIYPQKGQSKGQQEKDEFECHKWAKDKSGYDPTVPPPVPPAPPASAPRGGALRGAAKGAALGAVGGAIAGDAGKGAAIGAGVGGTAGAMRRARGRQEAAAQQQQAQQQQRAAQQQGQSGYRRALSACLEGRGYTVK